MEENMNKVDKVSLIAYKGAIETYDTLKSELIKKREKFNKENEELVFKIEKATEAVDEIKSTIKGSALNEYEQTQEKKLLGGIGIRVRNVLEYDPATALSWAKLHSVALSLDKRAFEKVASVSDDVELGFVTKKEVPTVTFPKEIKLE